MKPKKLITTIMALLFAINSYSQQTIDDRILRDPQPKDFANVYWESPYTLFDLLTDVIFWIKDTKSQVVYANRRFVEHIGMHTLSQVIGKSDLAFFPPHIAKQFITDDQSVMSGNVITDRLELNILNKSISF